MVCSSSWVMDARKSAVPILPLRVSPGESLSRGVKSPLWVSVDGMKSASSAVNKCCSNNLSSFCGALGLRMCGVYEIFFSCAHFFDFFFYTRRAGPPSGNRVRAIVFDCSFC